MPASGGVGEIEPEGAEYYAGLSFYGTSVFREGDKVNAGFSQAHSADADVYVFNASARFSVNDAFSMQPRIQIGYRDFADAAEADEKFLIPVLALRYKLQESTEFQFDLGGRFSEAESDSTRTTQTETYFVVGITKSF
jgi:hypothetical protein